MIRFNVPMDKKMKKSMNKGYPMGDLVVKSNDLINASYNLGVVEQRLLLLCIIAARKKKAELSPSDVFYIHASEYIQQFNVDRSVAYRALAEGIKGIYDSEIKLTSPNSKKGINIRWCWKAEYDEDNATVGIAFTEDVIPLISALEQRFTSYDIDQIAKLTSKYAIRLYELIISWRLTNKTPIYELDDFRNKLGLGVTEYKTMSNFNTNVLNIAIQQINKFTDIKVKVNKHKKGVKISGFSFEITQRKTKQQSNLSQDNTDKFYKLTDSQINMFGNQLSRLPELSNLAVEGESYEALAAKIKEMLREPEQQRQFLPNLRNLGFKP